MNLQGGDQHDQERVAKFKALLSGLGKASGFNWLADDADRSTSAVALVDDLHVLIPLQGLIDVSAETSRLRRQLDKDRAELKKSQAKLGNRRFVDKAPEEVVIQERERLAGHEARVEQARGPARIAGPSGALGRCRLLRL